MKRSHGPYSKQSRHMHAKGRMSVRKMLGSYKEGDVVRIEASPATKGGRPHLRFNSQVGKVVGTQGSAYKVQIALGNKPKVLVVSNVHLERV